MSGIIDGGARGGKRWQLCEDLFELRGTSHAGVAEHGEVAVSHSHKIAQRRGEYHLYAKLGMTGGHSEALHR